MITNLLLAAAVICGALSLLAFLSVISHSMAVPLLIAAIVCAVLGYFLGSGRAFR